MIKLLRAILLALTLATVLSATDSNHFTNASLEALEKSARSNHVNQAQAQFELSKKIASTAQTKNALEKSVFWLKKSHKLGHREATLELLAKTYYGYSIERDIELAKSLALTIINDSNSKDKEIKQAEFYLTGIYFCEKNYLEGLKYLNVPLVFTAILALLFAFIFGYLLYQYKICKADASKSHIVGDLLLLLSIYFAGLMSGEYVLTWIIIPLNASFLINSILMSGAVICLIIVTFILLYKWRGINFREIVKLEPIPFYSYLTWPFLGMIAILISRIIYFNIALKLKLPIQPQELQQLITYEKSDLVVYGIAFYGVVVVAIIEELLFRGVVHKILGPNLKAWMLISVSAIFFGVAHLDLYNMVPLILTGLVLAFAYYKTNNIFIPILIHATNNLCGFVAMLIMRHMT